MVPLRTTAITRPASLHRATPGGRTAPAAAALTPAAHHAGASSAGGARRLAGAAASPFSTRGSMLVPRAVPQQAAESWPYYDPLLVDTPVPSDQCPCQLLVEYKEDYYHSLGTAPLMEALPRLGKIGLTGGLLCGIPILPYAGLHDWQMLAAIEVLGAAVVAFQVLRVSMAWEDVGDRLVCSHIEYKVKGTKNGRLWPKTSTQIARDMMLENHTVAPAIKRLTLMLQCSGVAVLAGLIAMGMFERAPSMDPADVAPLGEVAAVEVVAFTDFGAEQAPEEAEVQATEAEDMGWEVGADALEEVALGTSLGSGPDMPPAPPLTFT